MEPWFLVDHLEIDRLLSEWRWLCPQPVALVARNAFGDLFVRDDAGAVFWLDVAVGKIAKVSDSEERFRELAKTTQKRREWLAEPEVQSAAERGLEPNSSQCIGFKVPLWFAESGSRDTAYIADLCEYVSFLRDFHLHISNLPDVSKIA